VFPTIKASTDLPKSDSIVTEPQALPKTLASLPDSKPYILKSTPLSLSSPYVEVLLRALIERRNESITVSRGKGGGGHEGAITCRKVQLV